MYLHYAESKGWKTELLASTDSDMGGYKDVQVAIKSNATDPSQGVWATPEVRGRRAPRAARAGDRVAGPHPHLDTGVLVFPEVDEPDEVEINPNDLKIDVYPLERPRRSERQHHRLGGAHHAPADRHRRVDAEREEPAAEPRGRHARARAPASWRAAGGAGCRVEPARKSQIRSMDRSERIRTYNFPENRIADHRTGYKAYNLDQVMNGALEPVIAVLHRSRRRGRLSPIGDERLSTIASLRDARGPSCSPTRDGHRPTSTPNC